jgi:hypothetical protein
MIGRKKARIQIVTDDEEETPADTTTLQSQDSQVSILSDEGAVKPLQGLQRPRQGM